MKVFTTQKVGGTYYGRLPKSWEGCQFVVDAETEERITLRKVKVE